MNAPATNAAATIAEKLFHMAQPVLFYVFVAGYTREVHRSFTAAFTSSSASKPLSMWSFQARAEKLPIRRKAG